MYDTPGILSFQYLCLPGDGEGGLIDGYLEHYRLLYLCLPGDVEARVD